MFAPIHTIEGYCRPAAPGLNSIRLVDPFDLQVQPSWWTLPNFASLQFKPGRGAFDLGADLLSGQLVERATDTAMGEVYDATVNFTIRNIRIEVEYLRAKMLNRRFHVIVTYRNGVQRYLPYTRLLATGNSGNRSERNQYQYTGTTRLCKPFPFLGATPPIITGIVIPPAVNPPVGSGVSVSEVTTTSGSYTFALPAGKLLMVVYAKSNVAQTVQIGTTSGGYELSGPLDMTSGQWALLGDNIWYAESITPIYISGLQGTNTLKFYVI